MNQPYFHNQQWHMITLGDCLTGFKFLASWQFLPVIVIIVSSLTQVSLGICMDGRILLINYVKFGLSRQIHIYGRFDRDYGILWPRIGKVMNGRFLGGYMFCDCSEYLIFARSLSIEDSCSQCMCQRNLVKWKHSFICSQWGKKVM